MLEGSLSGDRNPPRPSIVRLSTLSRSGLALILLAIVVLSLLTHGRYHNADASWLITVCEKLIEGKVLYRDILETNPPGAVLVYFPTAYFGKLTGLLPEDWLSLQAYFLGFLSLALSYRMLPDEMVGLRGARRFFLLIGAINLFVLPMDAFAQREHFATMLSLPMVASFVRFAETGAWPAVALRAISLLMAAVMVVIKPNFVLPGLCIAAYAVFHARSWRPLWESGVLLAGIFGLSLTAASLWAFPHYLDAMWPLVRDVYLPAKFGFTAVIMGGGAALAIAIAFAVWLTLGGWRLSSPGTWIIMIAAAGFLLSYLIQQKGFSYQAYPAAFFVLWEYWNLICRRLIHFSEGKKPSPPLDLMTFAIVVGLAAFGFTETKPEVSDISWAAGTNRPSIIAISHNPQFGFPAARQAGANWIGHSNSQWVSTYARFAMNSGGVSNERRELLKKYYRDDIQSVIQTIQEERPEFVLFDRLIYLSWLRWDIFAACPAILNSYHMAVSTPEYLIMRRDRLSTDRPCQAISEHHQESPWRNS